MGEKMRVGDYVFRFLADYGVRHVYMVSGGGAMFLNDGLGKEKRIRYLCPHHEQSAAIAAEGESRVTNRLSVVCVTTGPGGTNTLTGVIGQWLDSIPTLYLSGQVKFETTVASCPELGLRQLGDQEINIVDMVRPVTKYAVMITDPAAVRYELEKAVHIAMSGRRGPVWLDIPLNVQSAEIDPAALRAYTPPPGLPPVPEATLEEVAAALETAERPVILAGHGIRLAGVETTFRELVQRLGAPVVGTIGGFDLLPTESPWMIGRAGSFGTRAGNIAVQNADVLLCLGTRNNVRQVGYSWESFARRARSVIVVDIDAAELKKPTVRPGLPVHGDLAEFLPRLAARMAKTALPDRTRWLRWNQERRKRYDPVLPEYREVPEGIQPYVFIRQLTDMLAPGTVISCANATPMISLFQAGTIKEGQRFFINSGCASMGFGLPAALGAVLAAEEGHRPLVCLEGDGSLMMNLQELWTVASNHLPVKLFLFNNGEYASIRQTHDSFFAGRHTGCDAASGVAFPCWEKVAEAMNWPYDRIEHPQEAPAVIRKVLAREGRAFCEVRLSPGYVFSPKLSARRLPDGRIVSPSLEDMSPFLSREEMAENEYRE